MQEEVNEKTISLCIKGGKITAQILKAALIKLLAEMDKKKQRGKGEKSQCKKTGRQSMDVLQVFREDVDRGLSGQPYVRYCNGGI